MICKYLTGFRIPNCLASERLMHPSLFEQAVFCKNNPEECVLFKSKEASASASNPVKDVRRRPVRKVSDHDAVAF